MIDLQEAWCLALFYKIEGLIFYIINVFKSLREGLGCRRPGRQTSLCDATRQAKNKTNKHVFYV